MSPGRTNYDDRLADYVEVKERIRLFYEAHPDGRLVTGKVKATSKPDGVARVWVQALAFRSPDDEHPGVGWSWMILPGGTPYTRGSELENTETSAWGRAIGSLGIGIDKGIASAQEVRAKAGESEAQAPERTDDDGLIGTAEYVKGAESLEIRQTPQGLAVQFRIKNGRGYVKVIAYDPIARGLIANEDVVIGQRVTVWGTVEMETFRPKGAQRDITFPVMTLDRIQAPKITLPDPQRDDLPGEMDPDDEAELDKAAEAAFEAVPIAPGQVEAGLG